MNKDDNGSPIQATVPVTVQNISYSTAAQSAAFNAMTKCVRLVASTGCYVLFGSNPTATTSNGARLVTDTPEYFAVKAGDKLSVIQQTASGSLNVTEMA